MKGKLLFLGFCMVLCGLLVPTTKVSAEELVEHTGHITDPEFSGVLDEMVSNLYQTMSTAYTIDWSIPKNKRYTTAYFKMQDGTSVGVTMKLSGYAWTGIVDMDGNARYVAGSGNIGHSFAISKTHYYSFFVYNKSGAAITAKGHYTK